LRSAVAVKQCTKVVSASSSLDAAVAAAAVDEDSVAAEDKAADVAVEMEGLRPRRRRNQGC